MRLIFREFSQKKSERKNKLFGGNERYTQFYFINDWLNAKLIYSPTVLMILKSSISKPSFSSSEYSSAVVEDEEFRLSVLSCLLLNFPSDEDIFTVAIFYLNTFSVINLLPRVVKPLEYAIKCVLARAQREID